ncbi:kinase-like domain [Fusarium albosuccineum]|uniref:Kinase-like domain n=1 Tax=Fusarium albosuccineum TaxID=1237068 RepID=A0A8H4LM58_9HYPO|nr:kinase-like domain [Fusarium albosuccineum]
MGDFQDSPDVMVFQINAGDDDDADITFEYNSVRINLSIFASPSEEDDISEQKDCIEDRLIRLLGQAVTVDYEDYDRLINEALDAILDIGKTPFSQAAPLSHDSSPTKQTLHSCLFSGTLYFRLQTINSKTIIFPIASDDASSIPDDDGPDPQFEGHIQVDATIPRYSSHDIILQDVFVSGSGIVSKVLVGSETMLCKAQRRGLQDPSLEQELISLQRIHQADPHGHIRVPSLQGYVTHAKSGAIVGLLRDWIPCGSHGDTLGHIDISEVPADLRRKWVDQIRETVDELHKVGVIWGGGRASDVIIDGNDDIWLIDFAGGWLEGWVDEELAGSKEGDDQAVRKITEFLGLNVNSLSL